MTHIYYMVLLGLVAGMIASFWTRIIKSNMIFKSVGKWLEKKNNMHMVVYGEDSVMYKLFQCIFCLPPWIVIALDTFYIIVYTPWYPFAIIGVLAGFGASNFVVEIIYAFRH